ncbi:MAG: hypothetical protein GXP10_05405 [Gammaproteobacteria bacterium]|nr:hypothetical protein [Gammaproteobacteria bacterium]
MSHESSRQICHLIWRKRPLSARRQEDVRLTDKIKHSHARSRENYGARRILLDDGGNGTSITPFNHRIQNAHGI